MLDDASKLPDDPQELKSVAVQLATTVKSQALEIERLKHQLAGHLRRRFGSKSEASNQLDLQLRLEEEETAAARAPAPSAEDAPEPKEKPKRKPLPSTLPRIEEVLTPGDACACGGALRTISEDVTEELEYIPPLAHAGMRCRAAGPLHREPDRAPPHGLHLLREDRSGDTAFATDRARSPRSWPSGACDGQQIC